MRRITHFFAKGLGSYMIVVNASLELRLTLVILSKSLIIFGGLELYK